MIGQYDANKPATAAAIDRQLQYSRDANTRVVDSTKLRHLRRPQQVDQMHFCRIVSRKYVKMRVAVGPHETAYSRTGMLSVMY